jgi:hypothetical protein
LPYEVPQAIHLTFSTISIGVAIEIKKMFSPRAFLYEIITARGREGHSLALLYVIKM